MCGRSPCDKPGCTWGEAHRAMCEARTVAVWGKEQRMKFYGDVRLRRGDAAARLLANDVNAIRREQRDQSA